MDLDIEVAKLRLLKADYQSRHYRLEDQLLKFFPQQVAQDTQVLPRLQKDQETVIAHPVPEKHFIGMEIKGKAFSDKEAAGEAILAVCKLASSKDVELGHYAGHEMRLKRTVRLDIARNLQRSIGKNWKRIPRTLVYRKSYKSACISIRPAPTA